ncbi:MAG: LPS translocon maturation chaperone LptM [Woeseiaceae bacterium]|jgi:predicted small lipoprotein YifL
MNKKYLKHNFIGFLIILFLIEGCGQKGPLILPDEKPSAKLNFNI